MKPTDKQSNTFYKAVGRYLEIVGWRALVVGGVSIEQGDCKNKYRLVVDFMGGKLKEPKEERDEK
jgi:hypothetical protein